MPRGLDAERPLESSIGATGKGLKKATVAAEPTEPVDKLTAYGLQASKSLGEGFRTQTSVEVTDEDPNMCVTDTGNSDISS
jgi:hypothetical protein